MDTFDQLHTDPLFQALAEQALPDPLFVHDHAGRFLAVNRQACASLGYSRLELLGMKVTDVEQDFDLAGAQAVWQQIRAGETHVAIGRHRRKDGHQFPVEVRFGLLHERGERIYVGLVRDISQREIPRSYASAETPVQTAGLDLGTVLESLAEGLSIHDREGRVVLVNAAAEAILGRSREELIGLPCAQAFPCARSADGDLAIDDQHPVHAVLASGVGLHRHTISIDLPAQPRRWLSLNAVPIGPPGGGPVQRVMVTFTDISAQVATDAALRQSEQLFSAVFHNSNLGIGISRLNGPFVEINDAMLRIHGYTREEVIGRTALEFDMWADPEQRQVLQQRMRQEGAVNGFEFEFRRKDGSIGTLMGDTRIVSLGGHDHMISMVKDISEQKHIALLMRDQSYRDALTGLANRRHLHERLTQVLEDCRLHGRRAGLMLIDLDHFKQINEAFGHVQGDRVLAEAGRRLSAAVSSEDVVARFGGDEFVVLVQDLGDSHADPVSQLRHLSERIRTALGVPYPRDPGTAGERAEYALGDHFSASIGVTLITGKEADGEVALRHADLAMYRAKREGRDCVRFFVGWRLQDS